MATLTTRKPKTAKNASPSSELAPWRKEWPEVLWTVFEDLGTFTKLMWEFLNLPPPTRVQLDICKYLQHGPKRKVILAFRGVGKSWLTAGYAIWCLLRDPQINILVISASKERADQFSTFVLGVLREWEMVKHLYPNANQRCSKIAFDVAPAEIDQSPSLKSAGILGQITGTRADIIIADDIEVPKNSETQVMREKLSERVKEFSAILKPTDKAEITYLGTPQCEMSLYNGLPDRGFDRRIWPARVPEHHSLSLYGGDLAPIIEAMVSAGVPAGAATDPARFSEVDLANRELDYGRSGFALQFQLDTSLSDENRYPLKLHDLMVMDLDIDQGPEKPIYAKNNTTLYTELDDYNTGLKGDRFYRPFDFYRHPETGVVKRADYTGRVLSIDPSGRGEDETAYVVLYMLNGFLFLMDAGGFKDGYGPDTLEALAQIAKQWRVGEVLIESNFGSGMFSAIFTPVLNRLYPCSIVEAKSSGMKEARIIDTLEPVINQHRLLVNRAVVEKDYTSTLNFPVEKRHQYRLFYQLTRMQKTKGALMHDDRVDALAQGVTYWVEQMGADADDQIAARRKEELERRVEEYFDAVLHRNCSGDPYRNSWINGLNFEPKEEDKKTRWPKHEL